MKVIIPVAGAGTKLRPHTYTQPKALIPVAGKPILSFLIDDLLKAGLNDYVFVVGYLGEKIRDFVKAKYPGLNAQFVEQATREGIGHAVWLTKSKVGENEEVFVVLGDSVFDVDFKEFAHHPGSVLGIKKVEDPRGFGVAELDADNIITRVTEKPQFPKSNMALTGLYKVKESKLLFDTLDELVKKNERTHDEIQLTDAIMNMIDKGIKFTGLKVPNWFDCGKKEVLLETNTILLKKFSYATKELPPYENTIIIHPVNIAPDCAIRNSIIGPNVTIGANTSIVYSIIKDSIIGSYSVLEDVQLSRSVIGSDATVRGLSQSLNIGDNTEIDLR